MKGIYLSVFLFLLIPLGMAQTEQSWSQANVDQNIFDDIVTTRYLWASANVNPVSYPNVFRAVTDGRDHKRYFLLPYNSHGDAFGKTFHYIVGVTPYQTHYFTLPIDVREYKWLSVQTMSSAIQGTTSASIWSTTRAVHLHTGIYNSAVYLNGSEFSIAFIPDASLPVDSQAVLLSGFQRVPFDSGSVVWGTTGSITYHPTNTSIINGPGLFYKELRGLVAIAFQVVKGTTWSTVSPRVDQATDHIFIRLEK